MRIAALDTADSSYAMNAAAAPMLTQYHDECIRRGLIRRGEMFEPADCVPLI